LAIVSLRQLMGCDEGRVPFYVCAVDQ